MTGLDIGLSTEDRVLSAVAGLIASKNPDQEVAVRGSVAANLSGWARRRCDDLDLIARRPTAVNVADLDGAQLGRHRCTLVSQGLLDKVRPDIEVVVTVMDIEDDLGGISRYGLDIGTWEHPYDLASVDVASDRLRVVRAEWLLAEKLHLVQRRFSRHQDLADVRGRDVVDVLRWVGRTLDAGTCRTAADRLLDATILAIIGANLEAADYPPFWNAALRKAQLRDPESSPIDFHVGWRQAVRFYLDT
jgi:hypothetical protein